MYSSCIFSCKNFLSFFEDGNITPETEITDLRFTESQKTITVGGLVFLEYKVLPSSEQSNIEPKWNYDSSIVSITNGVIKGIKEGVTVVTIKYGGYTSSCIITVSGYSSAYLENQEPYIYSSTTMLQLSPSDSERINVSLYNGTVADIDGYTWTIDNPSVATLSPNGQYCVINAVSPGYSRIKVSHTKAAYPYYIGVYVFEDISKTTYITTNNNILTLNKSSGEKSIDITLANPPNENFSSQFTWNILDGDTDCIDIVSNGANAVIKPLKKGVCTVRTTHPDAAYPLDIIVRVIEIVENVYIEPSSTIITVSGSNPVNLTAVLKGLSSKSSYSNDDFVWEITDESICSFYSYGNEISLTGIKNGSTQLLISHPMSEKKRQVLIIVKDQITDAIDASCYITTSQNFVKTKVGAEPELINIMLKGGSLGDETKFTWSIKHSPTDGTTDNVISLTTTTGTVENTRAAAAAFASGIAEITPLKEGTAIITLSNPKSYYPTEILVKVLPTTALLEEPLYFGSTEIIKFLNSETYDFSIELLGEHKKSSDDNNILFESDNSDIILNAASNDCIISSNCTGTNISHLKISHPKVQSVKDVLILTADTESELESLKAFYSDKLYYSVNKGKTCSLFVNSVGFYSEEDNETFDFSATTWTSSNPSVATIEKSTNDSLQGIVTANSVGTAKITAKYYDLAKITFEITVYPEDVSIADIEKTIYLTTGQNVISIAKTDTTKLTSITAIGLDTSEYSNINWVSSAPDICSVIGNGTTATLHSESEGEAIITVSHPMSENTLKLYVRIGSEYVIKNNVVKYISTNTEIITLTVDSPNFQLKSILVNGSEEETLSGYFFSIDDSSIAEISSQLATGTAFIKPKTEGQAELTITHPSSSIDKKIIIVVGNSEEDLAAFKYLSTTSNVVTIGEGQTKNIRITVENTQEIILDGYSWNSDNPLVASISSSSGATAVVAGNSIGTTKVSVKNTLCKYPIEIIIQIVDPIAIAASPFIQTNTSVLTLTKSSSSSWTTVTAELIGGDESDATDFEWVCSDSSVIQAYGQNGVGKVRALKAGTAYLTISHPKAAYASQILCICDDAPTTTCSISLSCSNILSIKPTSGEQTITASLINGEDTDKYNFKWSLDVYDIIDIDYSGNTAVITPLKTGTCNLIVSHPKSAYDQTVVIKVSEYTKFAFGVTNKTLQAGKSGYVAMEVPTSTQKTHVMYRTDNASVATITGTNAVCQITGIGAGTTILHADLVITNTNAITATADLLVSIEESDSDLVYITSSTTIYSMEKGTNKTLTALLTGTGVTAQDQFNLKWVSSDPSIINIKGVSTTGIATGSTVYVEAIKSGETTITISHEKSNTNLVYYMIVPGEEVKNISLNKNYCTIEKNNSSEIKATIESGTNADYETIEWSVDKIDGEEIVRILGTGKTVSLYGIKSGTVTVKATLPNGNYSTCNVCVESSKEFTFSSNTVRVNPGKTKTVGYTVSPESAGLTWIQSEDTYANYNDQGNVNGAGTVEITGIKEGRSTLTCITSYGNKASLQIVCDWDYNFTIDKTKIQGSPDDEYVISYTVSPVDAQILIDDSSIANISDRNNGDGTGIITIIPTKEGEDFISIRAKNLANNDEFSVKTVSLKTFYDSIHIEPKLISTDGNFSRLEDGVIYIGDGETIDIDFCCVEDKARIEIKDISFENISFPEANIPTITASLVSNSRKLISHPKDFVTWGYIIPEWYDYYSGSSKINIFDKSLADELGCYYNYWGYNNDIAKRCCLVLCSYKKNAKIYELHVDGSIVYLWEPELTPKRNPSRDGEWVAESVIINSYVHRPTWTSQHGDSIAGAWLYPSGGDPKRTGIPNKSTISINPGKIKVSYIRNGKEEVYNLIIYEEVRNCEKTFSE